MPCAAEESVAQSAASPAWFADEKAGPLSFEEHGVVSPAGSEAVVPVMSAPSEDDFGFTMPASFKDIKDNAFAVRLWGALSTCCCPALQAAYVPVLMAHIWWSDIQDLDNGWMEMAAFDFGDLLSEGPSEGEACFRALLLAPRCQRSNFHQALR